eukprot:TRINITY_DN18591_c1_g1_i2.p1 TRINITY_DN18591_c1_g1~~TRINITY_DN18591_c1_g1_i2.p1  ORF type:complete len:678 (+),score=132.24 TRINITY_DN18591_c1_g1_i2:61-2094(+)
MHLRELGAFFVASGCVCRALSSWEGDALCGNTLLQVEKSQRALRSVGNHAAKRGCDSCFCLVKSAQECGSSLVTDGVLCGVEVVTDAARCGTETVSSVAKCGVKMLKACSYSRRRRWKGKFTCSFSKTAKSCEIAKTCSVAKSCNVANECEVPEGFQACLSDIVNDMASSDKEYLDLVSNSGCTSLSECRRKVIGGLDSARQMVGKELMEQAAPLLESHVEKIPGGLSRVKTLESAIASISTEGAVEVVRNQVSGYLESALDATIGHSSACAADGRGFWYLLPTDCGFFDSMEDIFASFTGAKQAFASAKRKLATCASLKGIFDVPTPFMQTQFREFCLPETVLLPIDNIMRAVTTGVDEGKMLAENIAAVIDKIRVIADRISLLDLGRSVHHSRASGKTFQEENVSQVRSDGCGLVSDWAVEIFVAVSIDLQVNGSNIIAELGFGLLTGCRANAVVKPNWIMNLGLFHSITDEHAFKPPSGGYLVGLNFEDSYPAFSDRLVVSPGISITPRVDIAGVAPASVPLGFSLPPGSVFPSGFTVSAHSKSSGLLQAKRDIEASVRHASGLGDAVAEVARKLDTSNTLDIALAEALTKNELARKARDLQSDGFAAAGEILRRRFDGRLFGGRDSQALERERAGSEMEGSQPSADILVNVDTELASSVFYKFCITPAECHGR